MTGVQTCALPILKLYPNPSSNEVHLELPAGHLDRIIVSNPAGQLLLETFDTGFSVATLSPGIYFAQVLTDRGIFSCKLIRE